MAARRTGGERMPSSRTTRRGCRPSLVRRQAEALHSLLSLIPRGCAAAPRVPFVFASDSMEFSAGAAHPMDADRRRARPLPFYVRRNFAKA
jgi:hypothetical protein